MFSNNRQELRQQFFDAWKKFQAKETLTPLEEQIVHAVSEHPEYHAYIENPEAMQDKDFSPEMGETNPFLHLSLHLSLREQINTNRPDGIREIFEDLCKKNAPHDAEHLMIDCLAETLWEAQRNQTMPDEQAYLNLLHRLIVR